MKFSWGSTLRIGLSVLNTIIPGVSVVEGIARQIPGLRGKEKQDAVVELVKQTLATSEQFASKDLANDAEVERATRGVIDAVVALQNILAAKAAAPTA
jgi:hypothetical protein